jgi:hypothetical protein
LPGGHGGQSYTRGSQPLQQAHTVGGGYISIVGLHGPLEVLVGVTGDKDIQQQAYCHDTQHHFLRITEVLRLIAVAT